MWTCLAQDPAVNPGKVRETVESDLRGTREEAENARPLPELLAIPAARKELLGAGSSSTYTLRHKVPKEAARAYRRAGDFSRAGDYTRAVQQLEKAVIRDPGYSIAYADLGVNYLLLNQNREAERALLRSIELDPSPSISYSNLAAVQIKLGNLVEAERSARRALELSSANDRARYLLGLVLSRDPSARAEAIRQLEYAARTVPAAQVLLDSLRRK